MLKIEKVYLLENDWTCSTLVLFWMTKFILSINIQNNFIHLLCNAKLFLSSSWMSLIFLITDILLDKLLLQFKKQLLAEFLTQIT